MFVALELSVQSLKEGRNNGFGSVEISLLACHILEPILKDFEDFLLNLKNFERVLRSEIRHVHGTNCPNIWIRLCHHSRNAKKPIEVFNSPTPPFVYGNLSIKKTWVIMCEFSLTRGLGLKHGVVCFTSPITLLTNL